MGSLASGTGGLLTGDSYNLNPGITPLELITRADDLLGSPVEIDGYSHQCTPWGAVTDAPSGRVGYDCFNVDIVYLVGDAAKVPIAVWNGNAILNDRILDAVMRERISQANSWSRFRAWTDWDGMEREMKTDFDTPFFNKGNRWIKWWYGDSPLPYNGVAINYMPIGHASRHLLAPNSASFFGVEKWNLEEYNHYAGVDKQFWRQKGWNEYPNRSKW